MVTVVISLLTTPPPFPIVQCRPRVVVNAYITESTPNRYDMVYVLLTMQLAFSILCNKHYSNIVVV